jgi:hypothetical protein
MNPIEIVQELPALIGCILERIGNFDIEKPVFSKKRISGVKQIEIEQVLY